MLKISSSFSWIILMRRVKTTCSPSSKNTSKIYVATSSGQSYTNIVCILGENTGTRFSSIFLAIYANAFGKAVSSTAPRNCIRSTSFSRSLLKQPLQPWTFMMCTRQKKESSSLLRCLSKRATMKLRP